MRRLVRVLLVTCLMQWTVSLPAFAQAPTSSSPAAEGEADDQAKAAANKKEASEHFRRGVELFQEEAYRAAVVEFERAYELAPDYRLLYNIGQTKLQVADYLGAAQSFERYLEQGGADVSRARREEVETVLAALRERVGRVVIKVSKDGAEVFVDDVKVGVSPLPSVTLVNVGRHRVSARTEDGAQDAVVIDVAGGDLQDVSLKLVAPEVTQTVVVQGDANKPLTSKQKLAIGLWVGAGVTLAGAGTTAFLASSAADDLDKARKDVPTNQSTIDDKKSSAQLMGITTDVLTVVGVGLAVAGTIYWLRGADEEPAEDLEKDKEQPKAARVEWGLGLGSIMARGQF